MDAHNEIRDLLALAAAGALEADEQRRVEDHLRQCPDCREELQIWQEITAALEDMPTPQAPLGLVERTRLQLESRAAVHAEHLQSRRLLIWLTGFAWISTLLTWPLFQFFGDRLAGVLDFTWTATGLTQVWIGYFVVSWMTTVIAAALLSKKRQMEMRTI